MSVSLSVVIPVYNGAGFIADTVRSALNQTYQGYEVIVVNDGSKDTTLEQLVQFGDAIKVISIPNGGVSNARNVGIRASAGELIAFLDADDIWVPEKLERQATAMRQHPGVGFCFCNYTVIDHSIGAVVAHFEQFNGDPEIVADRPMAAASALRALVKCNFVGTCSNVMVRRDVFDHAGLFDTRFRQAEDYDLWLRCAAETDFLMMSQVLVDKTTHETNLTNNFVETLQYHEMVLVALLQSPLIATRQHLVPAIHKELAQLSYAIGNRLFNRGESVKGFGYFWSACKADASLKNFIRFLRHVCQKLVRLILETLRLRTPYREY